MVTGVMIPSPTGVTISAESPVEVWGSSGDLGVCGLDGCSGVTGHADPGGSCLICSPSSLN
jgi:hypothetical protein